MQFSDAFTIIDTLWRCSREDSVGGLVESTDLGTSVDDSIGPALDHVSHVDNTSTSVDGVILVSSLLHLGVVYIYL